MGVPAAFVGTGFTRSLLRGSLPPLWGRAGELRAVSSSPCEQVLHVLLVTAQLSLPSLRCSRLPCRGAFQAPPSPAPPVSSPCCVSGAHVSCSACLSLPRHLGEGGRGSLPAGWGLTGHRYGSLGKGLPSESFIAGACVSPELGEHALI